MGGSFTGEDEFMPPDLGKKSRKRILIAAKLEMT
jgi:hypothetical protein